EGHAKNTVYLGDAGQVSDAQYHVTEFRGFEKFCEGRPFFEMAGLTARICGICPVSHLMASAKTGDAILAVAIPPAAEKLRRLMNLAQIVQSHALSFFHLSSPDLLLGFDSDPASRNVFGVIRAEPELARRGIRLRQFGQEIIEILGGRKIHPAWAVPGGVRSSLSREGRDHVKARIPEALETAQIALGKFKGLLDTFREEAEVFGNFPTLFMGLVADDGSWEHYGGRIRFVDASGAIVADKLEASAYQTFTAEMVQGNSYLKSPYYRPMGFPDGIYRVGPLARLNVCTRMNVDLADAELREYRDRFPPPVHAGFVYHYARLIEILGAIEHIARLVDDPDLMSAHVRAEAGVNQLEAVGVSEAPRGTLFHHYRVDENGLIRKVNLVIATGQNNLAMNRAMLQIARHYVKGPEIPEGVLNRLEAGIRTFDPCLSCSTHAVGMMPLHVRLVGPDGAVQHEVWRN
ncbi:MAG: Ni/Fe hydrogenase subunit alpha, partial [Isosphaeraceae bacterium]